MYFWYIWWADSKYLCRVSIDTLGRSKMKYWLSQNIIQLLTLIFKPDSFRADLNSLPFLWQISCRSTLARPLLRRFLLRCFLLFLPHQIFLLFLIQSIFFTRTRLFFLDLLLYHRPGCGLKSLTMRKGQDFSYISNWEHPELWEFKSWTGKITCWWFKCGPFLKIQCGNKWYHNLRIIIKIPAHSIRSHSIKELPYTYAVYKS